MKKEKCNNPSFSSTLLDEIYRSIDKGNEEEVLSHKKKNSSSSNFLEKSNMIDKWMENKVSNNDEKTGGAFVRRKSAGDFENKISRKALFFNSSNSSSSDSSSGGGGFSSSSEAEFFDYRSSSRSSFHGFTNPKPIITAQKDTFFKKNHPNEKNRGGIDSSSSSVLQTKPKSKSKPISPGGKFASFLNTLFTTKNGKKPKISSFNEFSSKSANAASVSSSSASSFSRSCLSKTPSSRGNGAKRSVRFYPVSIIVDEDCQPCGQKNLYDNNRSVNEELKFHLMEKNRKVEEAARNLLGNYQKKLDDYEMRDKVEIFKQVINNQDEDDDDDDAESYASSDLFELDNLSATYNCMERYCQELPVFETTYLHTNRAIANGFIL